MRYMYLSYLVTLLRFVELSGHISRDRQLQLTSKIYLNTSVHYNHNPSLTYHTLLAHDIFVCRSSVDLSGQHTCMFMGKSKSFKALVWQPDQEQASTPAYFQSL